MSKMYKPLFQSIKQLIEQAKTAITRNVNTTLLLTNFRIGQMIVEDEQNGKEWAGYVKETLKKLSAQLNAEFERGYSIDNL